MCSRPPRRSAHDIICTPKPRPNVSFRFTLSNTIEQSSMRRNSRERPAHHANDQGTAFQNPWVKPKSLLASGQVLAQFPLAFERELEAHHITPVRVVEPDFGGPIPRLDAIKATWLGHAGFMVEMPHSKHQGGEPVRILFDPIWSERASPNQYAGPKRRLAVPCPLDELPDFQFVVTSHNHYDHLDWPTIEAILKLKGSRVKFIAPIGNEAWFRSGGIPPEQVVHMDWGQEVLLSPVGSETYIRFICAPAQHGSGRGVWDQRASLWASWIAQQELPSGKATVYFAGDTGYMTETGPCPAFKEVGTKYGPFDLAMLPIWRGGSLAFLSAAGLRLTSTELLDGLHASPAHAVLLHKDIQARHSLGMHFATFAGSDVEATEPLLELDQAREKYGIGDWQAEGGFGTLNIGQTAVIPLKTDETSETVSPP